MGTSPSKITQQIRRNLRRHGVNDICVDVRMSLTGLADRANLTPPASLEKTEDMVILAMDVRLSSVLGTGRIAWLCQHAQLQSWQESFSQKNQLGLHCVNLLIFLNQAQIGEVDSDDRFHYTQGTDLRVALVWAISSDLGRCKELDIPLEGLLDAVRTAVRQDIATGSRVGASPLSSLFEYDKVTRFADGGYPLADLAEQVACREAGLVYHPRHYLY